MNQDPSNHYKKDVPEEELQIMYASRLSNGDKFNEDIFQSKREFDQELAKIFKLEEERKAAKKAAASSNKTPTYAQKSLRKMSQEAFSQWNQTRRFLSEQGGSCHKDQSRTLKVTRNLEKSNI